MMKTLLFLILSLGLSPRLVAQAQQTYYPKLEVAKGEVFTVGAYNVLYVDTLIMQDKSTIRFDPEFPGILQANVAFIGDKCTISSKGKDGTIPRHLAHKTPSTRGQDGGHLKLNISFEQLQNLTVDTRGGRGGDGRNGVSGKAGRPEQYRDKQILGPNGYTTVLEIISSEPGTKGSDATTGLRGGDGGNIEFTYTANNFIPVFNNSKARNSIFLLSNAGEIGRDGIPGKGGYNSTDGTLIYSEQSTAMDGQIKLIKVNAGISPLN